MSVPRRQTTVTLMLPVQTLMVLSPVNVKMALLAMDHLVTVSIASFLPCFCTLD